MIALNNIIAVLNLPVFNIRRTSTFAFQLGECTAVCRGLISVDEPGDLPAFHVI